MNDESLKLLEKLASKLGTTSEYLWTVLLKQAPIAAIKELVFILLTAILGVVLFKLHKRFSNEENKISYEELDVVLIIPMVIGAGLVIIFSLAVMFGSIPSIINGFLNPEFWALDYILDSVKE